MIVYQFFPISKFLYPIKSCIQFKAKISEDEVARCTFGNKFKLTGLNFHTGENLDQRPEFSRNLITILSS
jgi:hypothetical protein